MLPKMLPCKEKTVMSLDEITVYNRNIENIKKQENRAILDKKWTELAKLQAKRADFETKIKEIEEGKL
jgi:mannitol-specific phosphotransferase system IIBC component